MDSEKLADLLFPEVSESIEDVKKKYPDRPAGQLVTRFAPSPTGFLHLGGIFSALVSWLLAKQQKGVFFLRIEDTDQQRKTEHGVSLIINGLKQFGLEAGEGWVSATEERGAYGPYTQSQRLGLYHVFAKYFVAQGLAYPCWMSEEEIENVRQGQRLAKQAPGIYGNYALWRERQFSDIEEKISHGESFVIRLKSPGVYGNKKIFKDIIRGDVFAQEHFVDTVLLKSDGFPTYHFAHLVDDYLMGTTHVVRAEEWLPSVPLHVQLFELCGLKPPQFAHLAQLLKTEDGKKRKLSKRKDPEADVQGLLAGGFATQGILEYLMTIISPDYEVWQLAHPQKHFVEHAIILKEMNKSGALVDIVKMEQVNREYLARLSDEALYEEALKWGRERRQTPNDKRGMLNAEHGTSNDEMGGEYDMRKFVEILERDNEYMIVAIGIERHGENDPKRFVKYVDVYEQVKFFDDEFFSSMAYPALPEGMVEDEVRDFLKAYVEVIPDIWGMDSRIREDDGIGVQEWFGHLREFGQQFGYAMNNAQFKEGGWKGKTGDLAMLLRIVLCKAEKTPDLFSVMQVMGRERVRERMLGRAEVKVRV